MFPVLETERLMLREITLEDTEDIFTVFSNHMVTRYYGQETFQSIEQAKILVGNFSKNYNENRALRWGIERKEENGLIGTLGFHNWAPKHKRAEVGYEVHPKYWRKGYTAEAIREIIAYGFDVMGLTRIGAVVFVENEASAKLLAKIGFQNEGILRQYMYQEDAAHDTAVFSLLKSNGK